MAAAFSSIAHVMRAAVRSELPSRSVGGCPFGRRGIPADETPHHSTPVRTAKPAQV
jgi:hypothetical protein